MELPVNYNNLTVPEKRKVREEYIQRQGGLCYFCHAPLNESPHTDVMNRRVKSYLFPPQFFKWPVHLHHSHKTGMTLGAVHCRCNAVLWQFYGE